MKGFERFINPFKWSAEISLKNSTSSGQDLPHLPFPVTMSTFQCVSSVVSGMGKPSDNDQEHVNESTQSIWIQWRNNYVLKAWRYLGREKENRDRSTHAQLLSFSLALKSQFLFTMHHYHKRNVSPTVFQFGYWTSNEKCNQILNQKTYHRVQNALCIYIFLRFFYFILNYIISITMWVKTLH